MVENNNNYFKNGFSGRMFLDSALNAWLRVGDPVLLESP